MDNSLMQSVLLDVDQIQTRVQELAAEINRDYSGKSVSLICILKGGLIFLSDLCKHLTIPVFFDFISISSYGDSTTTSGVVRITKDLEDSIEDKHILIVEDIIDSGLTLSYLLKNLKTRKPASIKICTLLSKDVNRRAEIPIDYVGFPVPDYYLVGYGLDYKGLYRNVPFIFILKPEYYTES